MRGTKNLPSLSALLVAIIAFPVVAERNLIPSLGSEPDVCIDRPDEPEWMQDIALREVYKRVLVQDIYRAQNLERIVETSNCDCSTRFPSWTAAETEFLEMHSTAERWQMLEASDSYNRRANAIRRTAMAICEAAGNW